MAGPEGDEHVATHGGINEHNKRVVLLASDDEADNTEVVMEGEYFTITANSDASDDDDDDDDDDYDIVLCNSDSEESLIGQANSSLNCVTDIFTNNVANGVTNSVTNGVTNGVTNSVTNSVMNSLTDSVTDSVTNSVTDSVTDSATPANVHTRALEESGREAPVTWNKDVDSMCIDKPRNPVPETRVCDSEENRKSNANNLVERTIVIDSDEEENVTTSEANIVSEIRSNTRVVSIPPQAQSKLNHNRTLKENVMPMVIDSDDEGSTTSVLQQQSSAGQEKSHKTLSVVLDGNRGKRKLVELRAGEVSLSADKDNEPIVLSDDEMPTASPLGSLEMHDLPRRPIVVPRSQIIVNKNYANVESEITEKNNETEGNLTRETQKKGGSDSSIVDLNLVTDITQTSKELTVDKQGTMSLANPLRLPKDALKSLSSSCANNRRTDGKRLVHSTRHFTVYKESECTDKTNMEYCKLDDEPCESNVEKYIASDIQGNMVVTTVKPGTPGTEALTYYMKCCTSQGNDQKAMQAAKVTSHGSVSTSGPPCQQIKLTNSSLALADQTSSSIHPQLSDVAAPAAATAAAAPAGSSLSKLMAYVATSEDLALSKQQTKDTVMAKLMANVTAHKDLALSKQQTEDTDMAKLMANVTARKDLALSKLQPKDTVLAKLMADVTSRKDLDLALSKAQKLKTQTIEAQAIEAQTILKTYLNPRNTGSASNSVKISAVTSNPASKPPSRNMPSAASAPTTSTSANARHCTLPQKAYTVANGKVVETLLHAGKERLNLEPPSTVSSTPTNILCLEHDYHRSAYSGLPRPCFNPCCCTSELKERNADGSFQYSNNSLASGGTCTQRTIPGNPQSLNSFFSPLVAGQLFSPSEPGCLQHCGTICIPTSTHSTVRSVPSTQNSAGPVQCSQPYCSQTTSHSGKTPQAINLPEISQFHRSHIPGASDRPWPQPPIHVPPRVMSDVNTLMKNNLQGKQGSADTMHPQPVNDQSTGTNNVQPRMGPNQANAEFTSALNTQPRKQVTNNINNMNNIYITLNYDGESLTEAESHLDMNRSQKELLNIQKTGKRTKQCSRKDAESNSEKHRRLENYASQAQSNTPLTRIQRLAKQKAQEALGLLNEEDVGESTPNILLDPNWSDARELPHGKRDVPAVPAVQVKQEKDAEAKRKPVKILEPINLDLPQSSSQAPDLPEHPLVVIPIEIAPIEQYSEPLIQPMMTSMQHSFSDLMRMYAVQAARNASTAAMPQTPLFPTTTACATVNVPKPTNTTGTVKNAASMASSPMSSPFQDKLLESLVLNEERGDHIICEQCQKPFSLGQTFCEHFAYDACHAAPYCHFCGENFWPVSLFFEHMTKHSTMFHCNCGVDFTAQTQLHKYMVHLITCPISDPSIPRAQFQLLGKNAFQMNRLSFVGSQSLQLEVTNTADNYGACIYKVACKVIPAGQRIVEKLRNVDHRITYEVGVKYPLAQLGLVKSLDDLKIRLKKVGAISAMQSNMSLTHLSQVTYQLPETRNQSGSESNSTASCTKNVVEMSRNKFQLRRITHPHISSMFQDTRMKPTPFPAKERIEEMFRHNPGVAIFVAFRASDVILLAKKEVFKTLTLLKVVLPRSIFDADKTVHSVFSTHVSLRRLSAKDIERHTRGKQRPIASAQQGMPHKKHATPKKKVARMENM